MDTAQEFKERITAKIQDAYNELATIGTQYQEYKDGDSRREREKMAHASRWASWVVDRKNELAGHLAELNAKGLSLMFPNYRDAKMDARTFAAIEINNSLQVDAALTDSTLEHFRSAINAGRSSEYIFSLASRLENVPPISPDEANIRAEIERTFRKYQEKIGLTAIEAERQEWEQAGTPLRRFEAEVKLGLFNPGSFQDLQKVLSEAGLA